MRPGSTSGRCARRTPAAGRRGAAALLVALSLAAGGCARDERTAAAEPGPRQAAAEERQPIEATTAVDRAVATTGDVITYTVTIDRDPSFEVDLAEPGAEIAGFRIFDLGREAPAERRGRRIEQRWYKLRADLVGSYVLPPVTVRYRPAGSLEEWRSIETSALFVEVESVLPAGGEAADIRGLKPLRRVRSGPPWPWIGGGLAALALALTGVWAWYRRPRPAAPPVPAHELAFAQLDQLRGADFDDPAAVRRFHFRISEVVRAYVEGRWGLNATDLTSEEILPRLAEIGDLPAAEAARLGDFLRATDRVKFAEHRPPPAEIEQTWERALGFVEATRPRPEPADEADVESLREAA